MISTARISRFLVVTLFVGLSTWGCTSSKPAPVAVSPLAGSQPVSARDPIPLKNKIIDRDSASGDRKARVAPRDEKSPTESGVPSFHLVDFAGDALRSEDLVGKRAFAVVFFASWCELCVRKMDMVRAALEQEHGVKLLLVSVDGPETVHHVPGFLRERRLGEEQVVNGLRHPRFTQGYNPISSIPLVAVVGRSGHLVDYQVGLQPGDAPRLRTALHDAKRE